MPITYTKQNERHVVFNTTTGVIVRIVGCSDAMKDIQTDTGEGVILDNTSRATQVTDASHEVSDPGGTPSVVAQ